MALIPQRVGIEQQINATTRGAQALARYSISVAPAQLATLPNGVVAVYEGYKPRGGIYMRAAYADGTLSPEIFVDNAIDASVAALANGDIMVVLNEDYGAYGNILAKVYDANLAPKVSWAYGIAEGFHPQAWGGFFQSRVYAPTVVALHGTFFGVVWHQSTIFQPRTRVLWRFLRPPTTEPVEVQQLFGTSRQFMFNTTCHFAPFGTAFVYIKRSDDGSLTIGVFDWTVQTSTTEIDLNAKGTFPCIATDGSNCVVAWRSDVDGDIYCAEVTPRGVWGGGHIGVFTKVNQERGDLTRPAIAFVKFGTFVVAWEKTGGSGHVGRTGHAGHGAIKARAFTRADSGQWDSECDEFYVNSTRVGLHAAPSIVPTASGGFYAVWMAYTGHAEDEASADTSDWGIKGQQWSFGI
jgi:hypothetical protein